jgi:glucose-1-phosphate thymidylyltransferase
MRAIIPVAGVGTRLRPHTFSLPKVLLNVAGKPLIAHIIDALIEQGINKMTFITGYLGNMVEDFVKINYNINVAFVSQEETLGLGHAIWTASPTFNGDEIMIILGDTIFDVDLSLAINSKYSSIGVKTVEDPRRFGVVELDGDGFITKFVEKPDVPQSNLAIVGLYYINNSNSLKENLDLLINKDIKTRGEYQLTDALQLMLEKNEKFRTFTVEGWYDCGKPETLLSTNRILLKKNVTDIKSLNNVIIPPVFIDANAKVENSVIGPYATIANGARIKQSVIRDSIVCENASVSYALLDKSIIGNNANVKGHYQCLDVGDSSGVYY